MPGNPLKNVKVRFRGMCAFIENGPHFQALLLTKHNHQPVLVVRLEDLELARGQDHAFAKPSWPTMVLAHDADGNAIGVWKLPAGYVTFRGAKDPKDGTQWNDRNQGVNFGTLHAGDGYQLKSQKELAALGCPIIEVVGGKLECERSQKMNYKKGEHGNAQSGSFASDIVWNLQNPGPVTISGAAGDLTLKEGANVSIANLSSHRDPAHFAIYYSIYVDEQPLKQIVLDIPIINEETVFDCVPPTSGP